jgi:hypothetical protein
VPPSNPASVETRHLSTIRHGIGSSTSAAWWCHSSFEGTSGPVAAWQACTRSETARSSSAVCSHGFVEADRE